MKFNQILNNFSSGEWGPKMRSRTDVQQYANACETLTNFIPQVQGGAFLRSGTKRLVLEAGFQAALDGDYTIIPYKTSTKNLIVALDNRDSEVYGYIYDIDTGTSQLFDAGSITLSDPKNYRWFAAGDLLVGVHSLGTYVPMVIVPGELYLGSTAGKFMLTQWWSYVGVQYGATLWHWESFPFGDMMIESGQSIALSAATVGTRTVTAVGFVFTAKDVGRYYKLGNATSTGGGYITAQAGATATIEIIKNCPVVGPYGITAGTFWQRAEWSFSVDGYSPRNACLFQGRIIWGGTVEKPDTIWGSRIGNIFDLDEVPLSEEAEFLTYKADNSRPFTLTPSSAESGAIVALSSAKTLLINTNRAEINAYGATGSLGANDVVFDSSTSFGAANVQGVRINNFMTYVEIGGTKVRDVIFNFAEDQYKSSDLSFVAEHLVNTTPIAHSGYGGVASTIRKMCPQKRANVLWVLNTNNDLCGVTLDRDYQVNGWFRFALGDSTVILDIAVGGANLDTLFLYTLRGAVYGIEQLTPIWESTTFLITPASQYYDIPTYLDGHIKMTDVTAKTTWGPFTHLKNKSVSVIADGFYIGEFTVSNNASAEIVLPTTYNAVVVGVGYTGTIKTLPIEIGQQVPTSAIGSMKRIDEVTIKFWNSLGAKYGRVTTSMYSIDLAVPAAAGGTPQPLFTGYKTLKFPGSYDAEAQVIIQQTAPWPCNVLGIASRGMTNE